MANDSPSRILAYNVRLWRRMLDFTQEDLGDLMAEFEWTRQTVTEVERLKRRVYVDELVGLTIALETSIDALLTPALTLEVARTLNPEAPETVDETSGAG